MRSYGALKKIPKIILIGLIFNVLDVEINGSITMSALRGQSLSQIGKEPVGGCSFSVLLI